jgi:methionine synthase II (cobalamin-independent)
MDTEKVEGVEKFYEDFANDNLEAFRITENVAPGFYRFLERLQEIREGVKYIKCQLTGPFSMGLGLKDEHDKPIIYNSAFYDIIKKALHMKAKWMIKTIKTAYPEKDIIIFFDEPYMVSFGSSYVSISKQEATSAFNEVLEGLHAKRGVHVCGNTDWSVLLNADFDIINYDAYEYLDTIFFYREDLSRFLARGGSIAPGIVPSTEKIRETSREEIQKLLSSFTGKMREINANLQQDDFLITTSCGVGSLTDSEARKAMELLKSLSSF